LKGPDNNNVAMEVLDLDFGEPATLQVDLYWKPVGSDAPPTKFATSVTAAAAEIAFASAVAALDQSTFPPGKIAFIGKALVYFGANSFHAYFCYF